MQLQLTENYELNISWTTEKNLNLQNYLSNSVVDTNPRLNLLCFKYAFLLYSLALLAKKG